MAFFLRYGPFQEAMLGLHERVEADRRGRVGPDVEAVLIEGGAQELDLRTGGHHLGLPDAAEQPRADQSGEQAEDDHDHDHLDEGEAAAGLSRPSRGDGRGS